MRSLTLFAEFIMACHENLTSLLLNGTPSCHLTPECKWYVIVRPSLLIPPFASVGTSVARIGIVFLPEPSTLTSVSNESRLMKPSVVNAGRMGLRGLGGRPRGSGFGLIADLRARAHGQRACQRADHECTQRASLLATLRRRLFRGLLGGRFARRRIARRRFLRGRVLPCGLLG